MNRTGRLGSTIALLCCRLRMETLGSLDLDLALVQKIPVVGACIGITEQDFGDILVPYDRSCNNGVS